jgi:hypothetical protein
MPAETITPQQSRMQTIEQDIRRRTVRDIQCHIGAGAGSIDERLRELDQEWDVERIVEMFGSAVFLGASWRVLLGGRRRLVVPFLAAGLLLQHAVGRRSVLLPLIRRFGVRTRREIDNERAALKALRGDFQQVPDRNKDSTIQADELLQTQER